MHTLSAPRDRVVENGIGILLVCERDPFADVFGRGRGSGAAGDVVAAERDNRDLDFVLGADLARVVRQARALPATASINHTYLAVADAAAKRDGIGLRILDSARWQQVRAAVSFCGRALEDRADSAEMWRAASYALHAIVLSATLSNNNFECIHGPWHQLVTGNVYMGLILA